MEKRHTYIEPMINQDFSGLLYPYAFDNLTLDSSARSKHLHRGNGISVAHDKTPSTPPFVKPQPERNGNIHCSRPIRPNPKGRHALLRIAASSSITTARTGFVRQLKFHNACSRTVAPPHGITRPRFNRHKNKRLSMSIKAQPGLKIGI